MSRVVRTRDRSASGSFWLNDMRARTSASARPRVRRGARGPSATIDDAARARRDLARGRCPGRPRAEAAASNQPCEHPLCTHQRSFERLRRSLTAPHQLRHVRNPPKRGFAAHPQRDFEEIAEDRRIMMPRVVSTKQGTVAPAAAFGGIKRVHARPHPRVRVRLPRNAASPRFQSAPLPPPPLCVLYSCERMPPQGSPSLQQRPHASWSTPFPREPRLKTA